MTHMSNPIHSSINNFFQLERTNLRTMDKVKSPKIASISWGRIEIAGLEVGKDFKLFPGGAGLWDWGETGTRHSPGIQVADVEELLQHGATTVVLSRGMDMKLQVDGATLTYLREKGVVVHVLETREAVALYNSLVDDDTAAVGGLFHSTC